jgi:hypothetical protein
VSGSSPGRGPKDILGRFPEMGGPICGTTLASREVFCPFASPLAAPAMSRADHQEKSWTVSAMTP